MRYVRLLFILCVMMVVSQTLTLAQWYTSPREVCNGTINQNPEIASDGAGGAIIALLDFRSGKADLYAQRINGSGLKLWAMDGVTICVAAGNHDQQQIINDGSRGAIIVWRDTRSGTTNQNIYAQRINSAGVPQWGLNGNLICSATGNQSGPHIISDGAGGAIITWLDERNLSTNGVDIYAQRIDGSGVVKWTANGVPICTQPYDQTVPVLATDGANGAVIAWQDHRSGHIDRIYSQRVNATGAVQWTADGVFICPGYNHSQHNPAIAALGGGGVIISWEDIRTSVHWDIFAQRLDASGAIQWTDFGAPVCGATGDQLTPQIIDDGAGGAIISWIDKRLSATDLALYAQRINSAGTAQWAANGVEVCSAAEGEADIQQIVGDGAGGAVISWQYYSNSTAREEIWAQRINFSGVSQWTINGVDIMSLGTMDYYDPRILSDGSGGAIITAWSLAAHVSSWVQRISPEGRLGLITPAWSKSYDRSAKPEGMGFAIPTDAKLMSRSIAMDLRGNVYVTGYSDGPTKLDYVTVKYDINGNELWHIPYDGPAHKADKAYAIAVDPETGDVYVTGESDGGSTKSDIATIKYNTDGVLQWERRWNNNAKNKNDAGYAIAFDDGGFVCVTGASDGVSTKLDYITLVYLSDGTLFWENTYNGSQNKIDKAYAIAVQDNMVVVTGQSDGGASKMDYLTVAYDLSTHALLWDRRYNGAISKNDYAFAVAIDPAGPVYVTGASESATKLDYATVKYDALGNQVWFARYNNEATNKNDIALDIALDADGNPYVTGASDGGVSKYDYTTIKYNKDNISTPLWVNRLDGEKNKHDIARAMVINKETATPLVFITGSSDQGKTKTDILTQCIDGTTHNTLWTGKYNGANSKADCAYSIAERFDAGVVAVAGISDGGKFSKLDFAVLQGPTTSPLTGSKAAPSIPEVDAAQQLPQAFNLAQNYPNPFNPTTTIQFTLPDAVPVQLVVYNTLGQEVARLIDGELMEKGVHAIPFDGGRLATGVYFYRLNAGSYTATKKFMIMK